MRADLILSTPTGRMLGAQSPRHGRGRHRDLDAGQRLGYRSGPRRGERCDRCLGRSAGAVVRLPAVWVLVGASLALYGLSRRAAPIAWAVLVAIPGQRDRTATWICRAGCVTSLLHVPTLPGGEVTVAPLLVMLAIASALVAAGLLTLRRRDLAVG